MWTPPVSHPIRRLFAGLAENTFQQELGVADPPLIDYLSLLLSRFLHADAIFRLRAAGGERLTQVTEMIAEACDLPAEGRSVREVHRHIGDFTLFWTGVYPETLARLRSKTCKDYFVDYCAQGKRSYRLASEFDDAETHDEAVVLRRLSEQFEMCAYGLQQVRKEWEHVNPDIDGNPRLIGC